MRLATSEIGTFRSCRSGRSMSAPGGGTDIRQIGRDFRFDRIVLKRLELGSVHYGELGEGRVVTTRLASKMRRGHHNPSCNDRARSGSAPDVLCQRL